MDQFLQSVLESVQRAVHDCLRIYKLPEGTMCIIVTQTQLSFRMTAEYRLKAQGSSDPASGDSSSTSSQPTGAKSTELSDTELVEECERRAGIHAANVVREMIAASSHSRPSAQQSAPASAPPTGEQVSAWEAENEL